MSLDSKTSDFIKEHVEGRLKPIDLADIRAVTMVQIKEEYTTPEQIRCLSYLEHLSSDAKQLKRVLGKYHSNRLKSGRDLPLAIAQQWRRFSCERLCNMKKSEWSHNTEGAIEFMREYFPPTDSTGAARPGRLSCANSLQNLARPFRNRLLESRCSDIDMCAAAFTFALWLAETQQCKCNNLTALVTDPKRWRLEMVQETGLTMRQVKSLLNQMLFCSHRQKCKKTPGYPDFEHLWGEVQSLKSELFKRPTFQWAHKHINDDNPIGTFFLHLVFAMEAVITRTCVDFAKIHWRWNIQAIVHDGFNPVGKFNNQQDKFYLDVFGAIAHELFPGIKLRWEWKQFDFWFYDSDGQRLTEFAVPTTFKLEEGAVTKEEIDQDAEFDGDDEFEPSYGCVKAKWEQTLFKVEGTFVDLWTRHDDESGQTMKLLSEQQLITMHKNKKYSVGFPARDDNGKVMLDQFGKVVIKRDDKPFLSRWLMDKHMLEMRRFCMRPDSDGPEDAYNLWKPYRCTEIREWDRYNGRRIVIKFIDFTHKLLGQRVEQTKFALRWLAHPYVHPAGKPQVMAALLGAQGGGKSTFFQIHHHMMSEKHCYVTINPEQNVYGKNGTTCIADKKFINIQEVPADKIRGYINGLRPIVTDPRLEVKAMGKDPFNIDSAHVVGLSSNFLNAMNVDSEDERRFWIAYATLYWANAFLTAEEQKEFFETFHAELQSDDFVAEMYRFFIQLDLVDGIPSRFPKGQVPISRLQRTSRAAGEDSLISFFRELIEDDREHLNDCEQDTQCLVNLDGKQRFKNAYLSAKYKAYSEKRNWERASWEGVTTKMAFMDVQTPGLFTRTWCEDGRRGYLIDLDALRALCKSDVRTQRAILANRREHEDLDRELLDMQSKPLMRGSLEKKEIEARQQVLNARFEELLRPKDYNDDEEPEAFDAEAEYERVMWSKIVTGEHCDVQFIHRKDSMALPTDASSDPSEETAQRKRKAEGLDDDNEDDTMEVEKKWTSAETLAWRRGYRRHDGEPDLPSYEGDEKMGWINPKVYFQIEKNPAQYGTRNFWFDDRVPNMKTWMRTLRRWEPSVCPVPLDQWHMLEKYNF
jgi:hypothetical protein